MRAIYDIGGTSPQSTAAHAPCMAGYQLNVRVIFNSIHRYSSIAGSESDNPAEIIFTEIYSDVRR